MQGIYAKTFFVCSFVVAKPLSSGKTTFGLFSIVAKPLSSGKTTLGLFFQHPYFATLDHMFRYP